MSARNGSLLGLVLIVLVAACTTAPATTPSASSPSPSTSPQPTSAPSPAADGTPSTDCPTGSPLRPSQLIAAPAGCFAGLDVTLIGELAPAGPSTDPVTVRPAWLWAASTRLFDRFSIGQHLAVGHDEALASVRLAIRPGSSIALPATAGWYEVTGHRDDPAALMCVDVGGSIVGAITDCREVFVVTSLRAVAHELTPCPTVSPLSVRAYLAADPSCFPAGTNVTLLGWQDLIDGLCGCSGDDSGQPAPTWLTASEPQGGWLMADPTVVQWNAEPALPLRGRPEVGLTWPTGPRWVQVTGHVGVPEEQDCPGPGGCADVFVVTALVVLPVPSRAMWFCPALPVRVEHLVADVAALCWHGRDITVLGWYDPQLPDGDPPFVFVPRWLDPAFAPALDPQPGNRGLSLFVKPSSAVSLGTEPRWLAVTGHFGDPAGATCTATFWPDGSDAGADWARGDCALRFVVTSMGRDPDHPGS